MSKKKEQVEATPVEVKPSGKLDFAAIKTLINGKANKKLGKVTIMKGSDIKHSFIPTGIDVLDREIGGGFPVGISLVYGVFSSGKSTIALKAIAQGQKLGKRAVIIDQEGKFNPDWAIKLGVDVDNLLVVRGDTMESNGNVVVNLVNQKLVDFVVIDSIAAVSPKSEKYTKEGDIKALEDETVGLIAREMSKFNRQIATDIPNNNIVMIFISQLRTDISIAGQGRVKMSAQGGNSVHHAVSLMMRVRDNKYEGEVDDKGPLLWPVNYKIEKNHINGHEMIDVVVMNRRDIGPDNAETTLRYAKNCGIISLAGSYYSFGSFRTQGWEAFAEGVRKDPDLYRQIVEALPSELTSSDDSE